MALAPLLVSRGTRGLFWPLIFVIYNHPVVPTHTAVFPSSSPVEPEFVSVISLRTWWA